MPPSPVGSGWKKSDNGETSIDWLSLNQLPDKVLELSSCNCKECKANTCPCVKYGLSCTDNHRNFECSNPVDLIDEFDNIESDYYSSDDDNH